MQVVAGIEGGVKIRQGRGIARDGVEIDQAVENCVGAEPGVDVLAFLFVEKILKEWIHYYLLCKCLQEFL